MKKNRSIHILCALIVTLALFAACSAPVTTTPPTNPTTPPTEPTGLSVTGRTQTSISLSWVSVSGADSYTVYSCGTLNGTYAAAATGILTTSHTVNGLSANTTYYFKVSAVNGVGEGVQCAAVSGATALMSAAYDAAYNAFIQDYRGSIQDFAQLMIDLPPTPAGTTSYSLVGTGGGNADLDYSVEVDAGPPPTTEYTYDYAWTGYLGGHGSTIDGTLAIDYFSDADGTVTGAVSFVYNGLTGSMTFDCTVNSSGVVSGSYSVTYNGETHSFDFATGAAIS